MAPSSSSTRAATATAWPSSRAARASICRRCRRKTFRTFPPAISPTASASRLATLKGLIEKTRFAISTEETRYYLNGIYFHEVAAGNLLRAVATDGHRLAQAQIARPDGAKGMPGVIVPRKTVLEVVKLLEGAEADVEVSLSAAKIRFAAGDLVLTSKLIDGTFPDYERVIPRSNDKTMEIDTRTFASAVDRVSTISMEKGRAVKLHISADKLMLSVNNPDFRLGRGRTRLQL